MWLPWDIAVFVSAAFAIGWVGLRRRRGVSERTVAPLCKEAALLFAIYAVWIKMGEFTLMGTSGALGRGAWIWHAERRFHLPNEVTLQRWTLHAIWLVRFADIYYMVFHVLPLGVFVVWLYIRHRDAFPLWRNQLAFVSIVCLAIQYIPAERLGCARSS